MLENWNQPWPIDGGTALAVGQIAAVLVLSAVLLRQGRQHRTTLAKLDRLLEAAIFQPAPSPWRPSPGTADQVVELSERRKYPQSLRHVGQGRASHPERPASLYLLSSVAGLGGFLGGLIAATRLEDPLADLARAASVIFFLGIGLVRELFRSSTKLGA